MEINRIKFYYNARASLSEADDHWNELLLERNKTSKEKYLKFKEISKKLSIKLSNFISSTYNAKVGNK